MTCDRAPLTLARTSPELHRIRPIAGSSLLFLEGRSSLYSRFLPRLLLHIPSSGSRDRREEDREMEED